MLFDFLWTDSFKQSATFKEDTLKKNVSIGLFLIMRDFSESLNQLVVLAVNESLGHKPGHRGRLDWAKSSFQIQPA